MIKGSIESSLQTKYHFAKQKTHVLFLWDTQLPDVLPEVPPVVTSKLKKKKKSMWFFSINFHKISNEGNINQTVYLDIC